MNSFFTNNQKDITPDAVNYIEKNPSYSLTKIDSESINLLKLWMIIAVVFFHSGGSEILYIGKQINFDIPSYYEWFQYIINEIIARSAVPTYFILSAILLYRRPFTWKNNIKKKIPTLFIPYFFLNSIWIIFFFFAQKIPFLSAYFSQPENVVANWGLFGWVDAYLGIDKYPILYTLWFMRDLIALQFLAKPIRIIIDKAPRITGITLFILFLLNFDTHIFFLPMESLFFFSLGYYIVKYHFHFSDLSKIKTSLIYILYLIFIVFDGLAREKKYQFLVHNITVIIGILFFARLTIQLKNTRLRNIFLFCSKYSIAIYLFHEYSLRIFIKLIAKMLPTTTISWFLQYFGSVFFIITFCILLGYFMQKYVPKLYSLLTGSR